MPRRVTGATFRRRDREARARSAASVNGAVLARSALGFTIHPDAGTGSGQGPGFWALLAGPGPVYSFVEQTPSGPSSFSPRDPGRTGLAYEVKNLSGLSGRYARVYPESGSYRLDYPLIRASVPAPCDTPPVIQFGANFGCSGDVEVTFTIYLDGDEVGSCVASPDSGFGVTCTIEVDAPPGTVLIWTASAPPWPDRSGSVTVPEDCGVSTVSLDYLVQDVAPGIFLTDPDANLIPMTHTGHETWQGSQYYSRTDSLGATHAFTVDYTFNPCRLAMSSTFGATGVWPTTLTLSKFPLYGSYYGGLFRPPGAVDWTPPVDDDSQCVPLVMAFSSWWDKVAYGGGLGGPSLSYKRGGTCAAQSPYFLTNTSLLGGTWRWFNCNSTWIASL